MGYSIFFQIEAKLSDLWRAAETVAEIDEGTPYGMLGTGGLVHKHIT